MKELSEEQLKSFQKQLENLQVEISNALKGSGESSNTVTLDQSRVGRLSRMDALQQQAMAQAEHSQFQQQLKLIARALKKFDEQDYGWCEECDELIALERLNIKPESQFCIRCQSLQES